MRSWRVLLLSALHVSVLSVNRRNALPADQLNAVKGGQPLLLTGAQASALDVATAGMVVGQECSPDTPAYAGEPFTVTSAIDRVHHKALGTESTYATLYDIVAVSAL